MTVSPLLPLARWRKNNPPGATMFYKDAAEAQFDRLQAPGDRLRQVPIVVGTHRSKSIDLPVVRFKLPSGSRVTGYTDLYIRDNFYDLNVCVDGPHRLQLDLATLYGPANDWAWYLKEVERAEGYSWKGWSEDEIMDPRITRVFVPAANGGYWNEQDPDEKERWISRFTNPAWYNDWASGTLITEGSMGEDCRFYVATTAHRQGIGAGLPEPYRPGVTSFTIAIPHARLDSIVDALVVAVYAAEGAR